jgi:hypothetical protein
VLKPEIKRPLGALEPDGWRSPATWPRNVARSASGASILHLDFEPLADAPFHASVKPILGEPRVVRTRLGPGFVFRDEELVRDGDDNFGFLISQSRALDAAHEGREIRLGPGDATMMQASGPGRAGSRGSFGFVEVMIPPSEWDARSTRPDEAIMRRLPRRSEALQLLRGYLRTLEKSRFDAFAEAREIVSRHVIDLVVLTATSSATRRAPSGPRAVGRLTATQTSSTRGWRPQQLRTGPRLSGPSNGRAPATHAFVSAGGDRRAGAGRWENSDRR